MGLIRLRRNSGPGRRSRGFRICVRTRISSADNFAEAEKLCLYQGTTLVGPQKIENMTCP
jgi:hypothetical protein